MEFWSKEKMFSLNLHQAKCDVISVWVGGVGPKNFSPNLHLAKYDVISLLVGGKVAWWFWCGFRSTSSQIWYYLILGRWLVKRKRFWSKFTSSQTWCYLILCGWVGGPEKKCFSPNSCQAKSGIFLAGYVSGNKQACQRTNRHPSDQISRFS